MTSRELIRELEAAGWVCVRTKGSHRQFKKTDHPMTITVPHPKKDLGKGLVNKIRREAGLK